MNKKNFITLIIMITFLASRLISAQNTNHLITASEAFNLMKNDPSIILLDVRTTAEFKSTTGHLKNAILIPVQELENRIDELKKYQKIEIIVYCRTGHRSTNATEILLKHEYNAKNMTGGITQWNLENLPVFNEVQ
jgi:rhodanese-related sulfurtransferase